MADDTPEGRPDDFFSSLPMFGDLAKALQNQGPLNWDAARQFAQLGATGGASEPNVDPSVRLAFVDLARIAWYHVADVLGLDTPAPEPQAVTRGQWANGTLEAYRHLFTEMATALGTPPGGEEPDSSDPMMAMMAGLSKMMAPAMLGMAVGSMVGHLATRAFGTHDLPIPRRPGTVTLVPANIDRFAKDWEIPQDEMRLWVVAHELAHQWFGDSVGLTVWRDIWLNEGFATWAEWRWLEEAGGPTTAETFEEYYARQADTPAIWNPPPGDPGANRLFTQSVYVRGAMTLEALRQLIGDDAFYATLRAWTSTYRFGTVTTEDFIALAEQHSGLDLHDFFTNWLYTPGKPAR